MLDEEQLQSFIHMNLIALREIEGEDKILLLANLTSVILMEIYQENFHEYIKNSKIFSDTLSLILSMNMDHIDGASMLKNVRLSN